MVTVFPMRDVVMDGKNSLRIVQTSLDESCSDAPAASRPHNPLPPSCACSQVVPFCSTEADVVMARGLEACNIKCGCRMGV